MPIFLLADQVASKLSSQGWMDLDPDLSHLEKISNVQVPGIESANTGLLVRQADH